VCVTEADEHFVKKEEKRMRSKDSPRIPLLSWRWLHPHLSKQKKKNQSMRICLEKQKGNWGYPECLLFQHPFYYVHRDLIWFVEN